MKNFLVVVLTLSVATGCTSMRSYHSVSAASAAQIEPGSTATIEFVNGDSEQVEIHSYGETSLEVVSADRTVRSIDYAEIRTIHAKSLDKGRTAGAVIGGVLVLGLLSLASSGVPGFPSTAPAL